VGDGVVQINVCDGACGVRSQPVGTNKLRNPRSASLRECLSFLLTVTSVGAWKHHLLSVVCVGWQSIPVNGTVTSEYEAAMQLMTRRQVALGGYRLAALLEQLLQPAGHLRGSRK
jgi:hypothetical protein